VTNETVVSCSCSDIVAVGKFVLVPFPEPVTSEIVICGIPGEIVVRMAELASVP
jgi:hypothetical protein